MGIYLPSKLTIIFVLFITLNGCISAKKIAGKNYLLENNVIFKNQEELTKDPIKFLLVDQPNKKVLGIPIKRNLYTLAESNPDSVFNQWLYKKPKRKKRLDQLLSSKQVKELGRYKVGFNNWLKESGEAPVFLDTVSIRKSRNRLKQFFKNKGYFDTEVKSNNILGADRKATVQYLIETGEQYTIESITEKISSPALDSLYRLSLNECLIKKGAPFDIDQFEAERTRIINFFRNKGVYNFQQNSIQFTAAIDSSGVDTQIPVVVDITDLQTRENNILKNVPYKIHPVSKINIYLDTPGQIGQLSSFTDSLAYKDFTIFFKGKLKYKPKALEEVILIQKGKPYSDLERAQTYRYISNLRNFKYPSITYALMEDTEPDLVANIFLNPKERFSMGFDLDLSHSNIQDFGFSLGSSFGIRNIFRGAEVLEIGVKNTFGSSSDIASIDQQLFNLYELGADIKFRFPRILFPIDLDNLIPKNDKPSTEITFSATLQQNIGLDKQYFGASYQLNWEPNTLVKLNLKIIDLEFINNQNINNYFNVYRNSFDKLNQIGKVYNTNAENTDAQGNLIIPNGANNFITEVLNNQTSLNDKNSAYQDINLIKERQTRLTTNNLIFGSSFGINYKSQENILDESFFQLQWKLGLVGTLLNQIIKSTNAEKNENDQYQIAGVTPSQYIKTELNFIRHWQLSSETVLALRAFGGIAIPFGNANSIPFTRSYFSGGSNDNRGWRAYRLGPGSSNNLNEFNEANLKLTFNLEYRFPLIGKMNGALFVDAGNIWNVMDNVSDPEYRFDGFQDLSEIAIGSGFGLRYDFDFFVFRLDTGFKTYNPSLSKSDRWQADYAIKDAVFNIGINYPF
jgi:outer membrane protein assembly factor BamA